MDGKLPPAPKAETPLIPTAPFAIDSWIIPALEHDRGEWIIFSEDNDYMVMRRSQTPRSW